MDTHSVVARFAAERQALALMDHPNIARIFDGGTIGAIGSELSNVKSQIPLGRPYFVMELIHGLKITDYCDQNRLSMSDRLDLVLQVCSAVQHAHQKGIIHRDLKPSNILVTVDGGPAVPKIIDFGIAKAMATELTEKTLFTAIGQILGTPAYMSPEQAILSSIDIDTRSDIYSLGVLLYEVLTGQTPFSASELAQAGLDEMRRQIRENEPPRPSTRLTRLTEAELDLTAQRRNTQTPKLLQSIRGDLDWIVTKCLEKDRGRRYASANALAMDIRRHLDNEPVLARPPTPLYRFRKMAQRHRWALGTAAAVLVALLLGLIAALISLGNEKRERNRAVAAEENQVRLNHAVRRAERLGTSNLWNANVALATASRQSVVPNRKAIALNAISNAAAIRPSLQLRNEAIATLATADLGEPKFGSVGLLEPNQDLELPIAFTQDLARVAIANEDGSVKIRNTSDDSEILQIPWPGIPEGGRPATLRFSPDDRYLVLRHLSGRLLCWQLPQLQLCVDVRLEPSLWDSLNFAPDSRRLFAGTNDKRINVYELPNSSSVEHKSIQIDSPPEAGNPIQPPVLTETISTSVAPNQFAFAPSYRRLAITDGALLQIVSWPENKILTTLNGSRVVQHPTWSPDSSTCFVGTHSGEIIRWDIVQNKQQLLIGHRGQVHALALHPRGDLLTSQSWDGTSRLWSGNSSESLLASEAGMALQFSRDGKQLGFFHSSRRYGIWPASPSTVFRSLLGGKNTRRFSSLDFSPDGRFLLCTDDTGLWWVDLQTGTFDQVSVPGLEFARFDWTGTNLNLGTDHGLMTWPLHFPSSTGQPPIRCIGTPTQSATARLPQQWFMANDDRRGPLFGNDMATGHIMVKHHDQSERRIVDPERFATSLSESSDGRWLATGHQRGPAIIQHLATVNLAKTLPDSLGATVSFTPDGRGLIVGTGQEYCCWDPSNWTIRWKRERQRAANDGGRIAYSHLGTICAAFSSLGAVEIIDWKSGEPLAKLTAPNLQILHYMAFSPDDNLLAVSGEDELQLWDLHAINHELSKLKLDWPRQASDGNNRLIGNLVFRRYQKPD